MRKGLGLNRGRGYYNLVPKDPMVHSLSARGIKSAQQIFREAYPNGGKNFMTPTVLRLGKAKEHRAYELSTGDFLDQNMYGVTVIDDVEGIKKRHDLSKVFSSKEKAEEYIKTLSNLNAKGKKRKGDPEEEGWEKFEEWEGRREGEEDFDAKGDVYDNLEKKDSGVRIVKGVNGWRIENDNGKILCDKVFNDQLEAFDYYKKCRYTLQAKQFSMYGSKWKVVEKGKHTVMLRNKKGETLTITRDEYEQYRPRTIPTGEAIESVINAKGGKKWKVWVDGWDFEFKTVAKTEEQALKNVNEMTKGELSRLIEAGGDYNISQVGKKKKSLNAKRYHGSDWRKQYLEMEEPESCDIVSHLKHSKLPDSKFNKVQLNKGMKVEMEHTTSRKVAKAIAKAHLVENKNYYSKFNLNKNSKEYLLNAESFIKRYSEDQAVENAMRGRALKFKSKEHRDKVFAKLKKLGLKVKRGSRKGQLIHPEYIEDYEGAVETGFGNSMYQTMFPTLYTIEVKTTNW